MYKIWSIRAATFVAVGLAYGAAVQMADTLEDTFHSPFIVMEA